MEERRRLSPEEKKHQEKLRRIKIEGTREKEIEEYKERYYPKKKKLSTSKMALAYMFITCTAVQIFSMVAMWHFMDLTPLCSLIGATVGEVSTYCAYAAKSTKENTEGGIIHDIALKGNTEDTESAQKEEEING